MATARRERRRARASGAAAFGLWLSPPEEAQQAAEGVFGPTAAPLVLLAGTLYVNGLMQQARREAEGRAAAAAGRAVSTAATEAVSSVAAAQWAKLLVCVLIDVAGDSSFLLPGLGETADLVYAPLEAFVLQFLFASPAISAVGFVEEALPFTDVIPTATVAWALETFGSKTAAGRALGFKGEEPDRGGDDNSR